MPNPPSLVSGGDTRPVADHERLAAKIGSPLEASRPPALDFAVLFA
jgi:hypothetical protein